MLQAHPLVEPRETLALPGQLRFQAGQVLGVRAATLNQLLAGIAGLLQLLLAPLRLQAQLGELLVRGFLGPQQVRGTLLGNPVFLLSSSSQARILDCWAARSLRVATSAALAPSSSRRSSARRSGTAVRRASP